MNGFLNIDKPADVTSRHVVDVVKRVLKRCGFKHSTLPKLGYVGTLDPLATGVLVVAIGAATRLIDLVHAQPKSYRGTFVLGQVSDTDDVTGNVTEVPFPELPASAWSLAITRDQIETALTAFRGRFEQVPPKFSAVRVAGGRAYRLARRGKPVQLEAKTVEIHRLEIARFEFPQLTLEIDCSSGTYIRALGRDLGERLGCGAVMSELTRTRVGPFVLEDSVALSDLTAENFSKHMQTSCAALPQFPAYNCNALEQWKIPYGLSFTPRADGWQAEREQDNGTRSDELSLLLDSSGELLAVAKMVGNEPQLRPWINLVARN